VRSAIPQPHKGIPRLASELSAQTRAAAYSFAFTGMEADNELHGSIATSYDFGARLYDPRVGRWLSLDPLAPKYAELSPYNYSANNPILFVDEGGEDFFMKNKGMQRKFNAAITLMFDKETAKAFTFDRKGQLTIDLSKIHGIPRTEEQEFVMSKLYEASADRTVKFDYHRRLIGSSEMVPVTGKEKDPQYDKEYDLYVNPLQLGIGKRLRDTDDGKIKSDDPDYRPSRTTVWAIIFGHELGHGMEDMKGFKKGTKPNEQRTIGFENMFRRIFKINDRKGDTHTIPGKADPTPAKELPAP
jgi:RHS repeat-associated protein